MNFDNKKNSKTKIAIHFNLEAISPSLVVSHDVGDSRIVCSLDNAAVGSARVLLLGLTATPCKKVGMTLLEGESVIMMKKEE